MATALSSRGIFRRAIQRARRVTGRELPPSVVVLAPDDAWMLYDAEARKHLGMSAEEFERAWNRGEFRTRQEEPQVRRVLMIRTSRPKP
ncbi:MAG: hypothetical protein M0R74_00085 [Dehalococcoidia bacterium]|nr:hypothetical protein [Dehalococcoidia bacterium]